MKLVEYVTYKETKDKKGNKSSDYSIYSCRNEDLINDKDKEMFLEDTERECLRSKTPTPVMIRYAEKKFKDEDGCFNGYCISVVVNSRVIYKMDIY